MSWRAQALTPCPAGPRPYASFREGLFLTYARTAHCAEELAAFLHQHYGDPAARPYIAWALARASVSAVVRWEQTGAVAACIVGIELPYRSAGAWSAPSVLFGTLLCIAPDLRRTGLLGLMMARVIDWTRHQHAFQTRVSTSRTLIAHPPCTTATRRYVFEPSAGPDLNENAALESNRSAGHDLNANAQPDLNKNAVPNTSIVVQHAVAVPWADAMRFLELHMPAPGIAWTRLEPLAGREEVHGLADSTGLRAVAVVVPCTDYSRLVFGLALPAGNGDLLYAFLRQISHQCPDGTPRDQPLQIIYDACGGSAAPEPPPCLPRGARTSEYFTYVHRDVPVTGMAHAGIPLL
jgi:hypothetical protein